MNGSTLGVIGLSVVGAVIAVGSIPSGQAPAQAPVDPVAWQREVEAANWRHKYRATYDCRPAGLGIYRRPGAESVFDPAPWPGFPTP